MSVTHNVVSFIFSDRDSISKSGVQYFEVSESTDISVGDTVKSEKTRNGILKSKRTAIVSGFGESYECRITGKIVMRAYLSDIVKWKSKKRES